MTLCSSLRRAPPRRWHLFIPAVPPHHRFFPCNRALPRLDFIREGNIRASKLSLQKNGFALPHYSDSSKVAYVLQGIVKLPEYAKMPEPKKEHREGMALNCEEALLDVDIKNDRRVVVLNTKNFPLVGEVGLGADLVRLDSGAMCSPGFS